MALFPTAPPLKTRVTLRVLELLRLIRLEREPVPDKPHTTTKVARGRIVSTTNLTILNFLLVTFGPMHEQTLCGLMSGVQVAGSIVAFGVRYGVGSWFYGGDRR